MDYGDFVWFEIITDDVDRTIEFYTDVAGWDVTDMEMSNSQTYNMFIAEDTPIAGIKTEPPSSGVPSGWLGYIACHDLDRTTQRARELGGEVLGDVVEAEPGGHFDVIQDPGGGLFAAFQPTDLESMGDIHQSKPGHFDWCELFTTDRDASMAFFEKLFGWQEGAAMTMDSGDVYQMFNSGGPDFGGLMDISSMDEAPPPTWNFYFNVEDLDASHARAEEHGATSMYHPMEVPGGDRVFACMDPMGSMISFVGE